MNYFDLIFVIPLLWGAYKGFSKGLIVSVASLVALLLGIYGAIKFSGFTGEFVSEHFSVQANYLPLIAFALTFVGIVVGIHFIAKMLNKLVEAIALGWLNTIAGILFGLLKTAFILSVVVFFLEKVDSNSNMVSEDIKEQSLLYHPIRVLAPTIFPSLNEFQIEPEVPKEVLPEFPV